MKKALLILCSLLLSSSSFAFNDQTKHVYESILDYFSKGKEPSLFWGESVKEVIQQEHVTAKDFYDIFYMTDVIHNRDFGFTDTDDDINMDFGVYSFQFRRVSHHPIYMMLVFEHQIWIFKRSHPLFYAKLLRIKEANDSLISDSELIQVFKYNTFLYGDSKLDTYDRIYHKIGCIQYLATED